jgi:hypothetical protein
MGAIAIHSRIYHRDIAAFASPKGTLDCIKASAKQISVTT